ncbi:MAG: hypothetical protein FWC50_00875, partial [Planctomycetaceae bacterium]|nr:hypothetical protein [Planctomycetaceae bacterium]
MSRTKKTKINIKKMSSDHKACLERSGVLEPTRKKPLSLIAVALGITTAMASAGFLPDPISSHPAMAQTYQQAVQTQPVQTQAVQTAAPATAAPGALQQSDQLLLAARMALAGGDHVTAEAQVNQAQSLRVAYQAQDDRPAYVAELIRQHRVWLQECQKQGSDSGETARRMRAECLAQQADGFYRRGDLNMADKVAREAMNQNVMFSTAMIQKGFEPVAILKRINDARIASGIQNPQNTSSVASNISSTVQRQAQNVMPQLAEARKLIAARQFDQAEAICINIANQNIPESAFATLGDSPTQVLRDISVTRHQLTQQNPIMQASATTPAIYNPAVDMTSNVPVQGSVPVPTPVPGVMPGTQQPGTQPGIPSLLDRAQPQNPDFTRQASEHEFVTNINQQITRSQQMMAENPPNPPAAIENLKAARTQIEAANISPEMKASLTRRLDRELEQMVDYQNKYGAQIALDRQNQAVRDQVAKEREHNEYVEMKLKEFTEEYNRLMREERFEEAVRVAEKAQAIAPRHVVTTQLMATATIADRNDKMNKAKAAVERGVFNQFLDEVRASAITVNDRTPLVYAPDDYWAKVKNRASFEKLGAPKRSEAEQAIYDKLQQNISLNTNGTQPLQMVINKIKSETGINIVIDDLAIREMMGATPVGAIASDPGSLSVELALVNDIPLSSALKLMLERQGLSYTVEDDVLKITTPAKSRGKRYSKVYYIGDIVAPIPDFIGNNPGSLEEAYARGMNIAMNRGSGFGVNGSFVGLGTANHPIVATATPNGQKLNNVGINPAIMAQINSSANAAGGVIKGARGRNPLNQNGSAGGGGADFDSLIDLIETTIAPDSWDQNAELGTSGSITPYYNNLSLVINQTEDVHQKIEDLLAQLRKMNDLQITVEVRFITLNDSFFESMGMDFDINLRNSQRGKFSSLNATASTNTTNNNTTGTTNNQSTSLNSDSFTEALKAARLIAGLQAPGNANAPNFAPDLGVSINQNSIDLVKPTFGGFQDAAGASLGFAIMSDIETYFFMSAAQGDSRSNVLQAPKVTMMNGQWASVNDSGTRSLVIGINPVVGDFAVAQQPVVTMIPEGLFLSVQATVSSDRRFVRMTLSPQFMSITSVDTFRYEGSSSVSNSSTTGGTGTGGTGTNTGNSQQSDVTTTGTVVQQPNMKMFSVSTTVSVPDGGTILLGGVKRLSEARKEYGVPMVNKIPYLKRLFSNTSVGRDTESLMMMVTPHII